MWCGIITLFPEMFRAITDYGITRRAVETGLLTLAFWNPRDFTVDRYKTVDDRPYGGGPGMVMCAQPLAKAIQAARFASPGPARVIYLSPQGKCLNHQGVQALVARLPQAIFVAGRYEGVDERVLAQEVDEEWSIGDYVLSGGELATMVLIDAIIRWVPGVLGHEASAKEDSFVDGLLDCPQYTRPEVIGDQLVPPVLLSGDHAAIRQWRLKQRLGRTWLRRPDLLEQLELTTEAQVLLQEWIDEQHNSSN